MLGDFCRDLLNYSNLKKIEGKAYVYNKFDIKIAL